MAATITQDEFVAMSDAAAALDPVLQEMKAILRERLSVAQADAVSKSLHAAFVLGYCQGAEDLIKGKWEKHE